MGGCYLLRCLLPSPLPWMDAACDILRVRPHESSETWMRYLIEDFFEQSWMMKLFISWGWLCAIIMATSFIASMIP